MPDTKRTATGVLGGLAGLVGLSAVAGILVTATVTPAIAVSGVAASSAISLFDKMPSILEIDKLMQPTTLFTQNRDNGAWEEWTSFYDQNRSPVTFDQVAPVMYDAILSSEDPRYYQHGGVDLIGTTRALLSNASGGQTQGGSSISQQYVKNVLIQKCERDAVQTESQTREEVLQSCWLEATNAKGPDGYERKLQEMRYAIQLEKQYSKNDILLGYLNIANFGGTTYGIDAAAKYYFGVPASQLSLGQAAALAGVVQNPNTYRIDKKSGSIVTAQGSYNKEADGSIDDVDPQTISALFTLRDQGTITQEQLVAAADGYSATKGRQLYVLSRLLSDGKITQDQYVAAAVEPLSPNIQQPRTGCASTGRAAYFCQYVVSVVRNDPAFGATPEERQKALRQDGLQIYTTLDRRLQNVAETSMADNAPASMPGTRYGATAVSVEPSTGKVLAIAQNTTFTEDRDLANSDPAYTSIVYAGNSMFGTSDGFSAGSTFKLFTLIDWLEKGHSVRETVNGSDVPISRFTNSCIGNIVGNTWKPGNFGGTRGYTGTPLQFTRDSLNSGYVAMAADLDLCDIGKTAAKLGVMGSDGEPIQVDYPTQIIGPDAVSPMAMAGAYGTVANKGVYCQPQAIERVTDSDGNELAKPDRTCTQVISPEVAATAAFALEGVMAGGGTGSRANPGGAAVLGKTGTHQEWQTWMVESSTRVATAVWAGNANGNLDVFKNFFNGRALSDIRYVIARDVQGAANDLYGGDDFPTPDSSLTRQTLREVPNVVGQTIDEAQQALQAAGWSVSVGDPVDSDRPTNVVAQQDPSGSAAVGTTITIRPSNGQAATVPSVAGTGLNDARAALQGAGFTNLSGSCTADPAAPPQGLVTGTNPGAGTAVGRGSAVTISYSAKNC